MENKENGSIFATTPETNPKEIDNVFSKNEPIISTNFTDAVKKTTEPEINNEMQTLGISAEKNEIPNSTETTVVKEDLEVKYEEVEIKKNNETPRMDSHFDGKLLDLIGWTFLRNILAILTLGIASSWGDCMLLNFKLNHTVINGKRLKFVGNGGDLFIEKFKWTFFSIITLGIYTFWIPVKKTKWILSNVHFEDEEYVKEESYFDGKVIQLIGINILCNFLNLISLSLLYPFTTCIKLRWIAKNSVINKKKIVFDGTGMNLFGHYLLWIFLTIITLGIYGFWLNINIIKWKIKNLHIKLVQEEYKKDKSIIVMAIIFVILFIISIIILISNPFSFESNGFGPQGINGSTQERYPNNNYDTYYDGYYYYG